MFCNFSCPLGQNLEMTYNLFWQIIGQQVIYQSSNTSNPFLAQHPARPNVSNWGEHVAADIDAFVNVHLIQLINHLNFLFSSRVFHKVCCVALTCLCNLILQLNNSLLQCFHFCY